MILESEDPCMYILNGNKKAGLKCNMKTGKITTKGVGSKKQLSLQCRSKLIANTKTLFHLNL